MADMTRRPNRTPRRVREKRAFQLVVASGATGVAAVVTFVLALVGIGSIGIAILLAVISALCFFLFRRTVS